MVLFQEDGDVMAYQSEEERDEHDGQDHPETDIWVQQ